MYPISNIDIVYTWVNGQDPNWIREKNHWLNYENNSTILSSIDNSRFIEHEELKYSFRSLFMNAPWIHHIFLVTNGQIPVWLNISHPKITMIRHEDIMPAAALPTFNSEAIESCLPFIENLSEYFLYANDDCFFYRPIRPQFFFTRNGKCKIRVGLPYITTKHLKRSNYFVTLNRTSELFKSKFGIKYNFEPSHNIMPYRKSFFLGCIHEFPDSFRQTAFTKFRNEESIQRSIVTFYEIYKNQAIVTPSLTKTSTDALFIRLQPTQRMRYRLRKIRPQIICINDHEYADDSVRLQLKPFLNSLFPIASPLEFQNNG